MTAKGPMTFHGANRDCPGVQRDGWTHCHGHAITPTAIPGEGPTEHLRNALMLLGGLKRALAVTGLNGPDADAMLEGITRRIGLALDQLKQGSPRGAR